MAKRKPRFNDSAAAHLAQRWRDSLEAERKQERLASCGADGYELAKLVVAFRADDHVTAAELRAYAPLIDLARRIVKKVEGGK